MTPHIGQIGEGDWRSLAEQASNEMDPSKLSALVSQLCRALDDRDENARQRRLASAFGSSPRIMSNAVLPF